MISLAVTVLENIRQFKFDVRRSIMVLFHLLAMKNIKLQSHNIHRVYVQKKIIAHNQNLKKVRSIKWR